MLSIILVSRTKWPGRGCELQEGDRVVRKRKQGYADAQYNLGLIRVGYGVDQSIPWRCGGSQRPPLRVTSKRR